LQEKEQAARLCNEEISARFACWQSGAEKCSAEEQAFGCCWLGMAGRRV